MRACTRPLPEHRPSIREVLQTLSGLTQLACFEDCPLLEEIHGSACNEQDVPNGISPNSEMPAAEPPPDIVDDSTVNTPPQQLSQLHPELGMAHPKYKRSQTSSHNSTDSAPDPLMPQETDMEPMGRERTRSSKMLSLKRVKSAQEWGADLRKELDPLIASTPRRTRSNADAGAMSLAVASVGLGLSPRQHTLSLKQIEEAKCNRFGTIAATPDSDYSDDGEQQGLDGSKEAGFAHALRRPPCGDHGSDPLTADIDVETAH